MLARVCLALGKDAEAAELCAESERLAGHALKASIAWRMVRAQLLAGGGAHDEARRVAEEAVVIAGRTDALVDHGDACLTKAMVLSAAGDEAGARAAAEQAVELYERKGAAALAEKARELIHDHRIAVSPPGEAAPNVEPDTACVRILRQLDVAYDRDDWDAMEQLIAAVVSCDSRRKVVGVSLGDVPSSEWMREARSFRDLLGPVRYRHTVVAVRGERLALTSLQVGPADESPGAPRDELLQLYGLDEQNRIALQMWFDLDDIDAAMAEIEAQHSRSEQSHPRRHPLENAASRAWGRLTAHFSSGDWAAMSQAMVHDMIDDDRRRTVNGGIRRGRDIHIANGQAVAETGTDSMTSSVIAIRGSHLALCRSSIFIRDQQPGSFSIDFLSLVQVDDEEQIVAHVGFDTDDLQSAIAELDDRYLAGDAAAYAETWSVIAQAYASLDRHEVPASTPGWVNVDHRRAATIAPDHLIEHVLAAWDLAPNIRFYIEEVHRLNHLGAVITRTTYGTSTDGFDAEWRTIDILTVDGGLTNRCEIFDEADLETALARFDELNCPPARLENSALRTSDRYLGLFPDRAWDAMEQMLADDFIGDDRRRVINSGERRGRESEIANLKATAEIGCTRIQSSPIAVRGERIVLVQHSFTIPDWPDAFDDEMISVVEINGDGQISAQIGFSADDLDAAFAELEARYLAGEAANNARTWSAIVTAFAAMARQELFATTPDWVSFDHRKLAMVRADWADYVTPAWDLTPHFRDDVEAVHRLTEPGAVVTFVASGTTQQGLDVEWRGVGIFTVDGELISRCEIFDEDDLDVALERLEELSRPAPRLENTASRVGGKFAACFATRDWAAMAATLANDVVSDDRRRVVNSGVRVGRDVQISDAQAAAELGAHSAVVNVIATRGDRLALTRISAFNDRMPGESGAELLGLAEVNSSDRLTAMIAFSADDFDAAIAELEARYAAGEGAAHARTWTVITEGFATLNRHEIPVASPDFVIVDQRRGIPFASGDLTATISASTDLTPDLSYDIEAVHALSDVGAVVTQVNRGRSREGFDAEWRLINVLTLDDELINRSELYDEADLDVALARLDELTGAPSKHQNAASRIVDRLLAQFSARAWNVMAEQISDDFFIDDRRRTVNAGIRYGRDAEIEDLRAAADVGFRRITSTVIASRGDRLILTRIRVSGQDPEAVQGDALQIVGIDADEQIAAVVVYELDEFDSAVAELDARYLAGEATVHAHTWELIAEGYAALNRREVPATTPDWVNIDHRRGTPFAPGELIPFIHAAWEDTPDVRIYIAAVFRLTDSAALVATATHGTSHEGFGAEWREVSVLMFDGDRFSRCEMYDERDFDVALARFDELTRPAPRIESAANRVYDRFKAHIDARDWEAMAQLFAEDVVIDDRRRVVNAGLRHGRDVVIQDLRIGAEIGLTEITPTDIATRGDRLTLRRIRYSGTDHRPDTAAIDLLQIIEIDADDRTVALVLFDLDDIDAAFAELDARYLAGEAAAHAQAWSVIAKAYAALNRRELPATTPDWVNIDHQQVTTVAPGDFITNIRASWDVAPELRIYIEAVHWLTDRGAVITHSGHGTSPAGFDAEWRTISLFTVDGDLISRCELFDEADLDAAVARFDELSRTAPQLENAASRAYERLWTHFAARDWAAMAEVLAPDIRDDDRRRVVNAGVRHGRDALIANLRAFVEVGVDSVTPSVVATRGERLALSRVRLSGLRGEVSAEVLNIAEIDSDNQMVASVVFDPDDIDAAIAELDARYVAGEGAAHAHTWSLIAQSISTLNRRETPATTPDYVIVDHQLHNESSGLTGYLHASWELTPDLRMYIEAVHRLSDLGAVVTLVLHGTSQDGFGVEWRIVEVLTREGDAGKRCEIFSESDLDAALARFDELDQRVVELENAASRLDERFKTSFAARDWDAMAEILADDFSIDDRRRVVNIGIRNGRDVEIANMRATAEIGTKAFTFAVIATRGERLALSRIRAAGRDQRPEAFHTEALGIVEMNADNRIAARVAFDLDDIDAAFEELDARYLAGEAAQWRTWPVVAKNYAGLNRHEIPATTPDWVNIDHRRVTTIAPGYLISNLHAQWDLTPQARFYVEAVHRLTDLGAVVTHSLSGTSQEGFQAEWRMVNLLTFEGDLMNRSELFDESDLDTALARFDELSTPAKQLDNAASQTSRRLWACFAARDWKAISELLAEEVYTDDRRRVVNAGVLRGRQAEISNLQTTASLGITNVTSVAIATRGERLALTHFTSSNQDLSHGEFDVELLSVVEIDSENRIVAGVHFDPGDLDAAFAELDARYLAGEAAEYAHTWSVVSAAYTALNRHELPATTPDWVNLDRRRGATFAPGEMTAYLRSAWDLKTDRRTIEAVHRLNYFGAVVTRVSNATSHGGFDAEWRAIDLVTVEGDLISRCEIYRRGRPRRRAREVR